jgi:hypothetical protein
MQATQQERMLADAARAVAWTAVPGQVPSRRRAGKRADCGGRRPVNLRSIANHGAVAWKGDGREVQKPVCLRACVFALSSELGFKPNITTT